VVGNLLFFIFYQRKRRYIQQDENSRYAKGVKEAQLNIIAAKGKQCVMVFQERLLSESC